jgi:hypothetical protein
MSEVLAYTPEFDQINYDKLWEAPLPDRFAEKERLDSYTDQQLQTLLAERFNVLTSTFYYEMRDGQLWGENMTEPAIESFKRGRDYRRQIGNPVDWEREDAEVEGFQKIEEMLRSEKDVISISPKGVETSTYQHNFYDVFRWRNGRIEVKRYSSALDISDYQKILGVCHTSAADFLANPINVSNSFESADQVHEFLHRDHDYTDDDTYQNVILPTAWPYRLGYMKARYEGDDHMAILHLNAMMNAVDEAVRRHRESGVYQPLLEYGEEALIELGNREVRETKTGCGGSGGFKNKGNGTSPFSVSEFGEREGRWFTCPKCSYEANGPIGNECPGCGLTKEKYAETAEVVC